MNATETQGAMRHAATRTEANIALVRIAAQQYMQKKTGSTEPSQEGLCNWLRAHAQAVLNTTRDHFQKPVGQWIPAMKPNDPVSH